MANGNFGGGDGSQSNPFIVDDAADFNRMRIDPDYFNNEYYYIQSNDIDLNWANFDDNIEYWIGHYNGNNKSIKNITLTKGILSPKNGSTISNLFIDNIHVNINYEFIGVFNIYSNGGFTFDNVHIRNANISAEGDRVSIFGNSIYENEVIQNCSVQGSINFIASGVSSYCAGFICHMFYNSQVINCQSKVDINVDCNNIDTFIAGFVATIGMNSVVQNSFFDGSISSNALGIIGGFVAHGNSDVNLIKCFANADIEINSDYENNEYYIGLFAGSLYGISPYNLITINNCYAIGSITLDSVGDYSYFSGFCGCSYFSVFNNCYSACDINIQHSRIKGFIGYNYGAPPEYSPDVNYCYYDYNLVQCSDDYATNKTTSEMKTQSTYVSYDFENLWRIRDYANNGYPYLIGITVVNPFLYGTGTEEDPYWIDTLELLQIIEDFPNSYFILKSSIFISDYEYWRYIHAYIISIGSRFNFNGYEIGLIHPFYSGTGVQDDPFIITDIEHLNYVENYPDAYFKLNNNVNIPNYSTWYDIINYLKTIRDYFNYNGYNITTGFSMLLNNIYKKKVTGGYDIHRIDKIYIINDNIAGVPPGVAFTLPEINED